MNKIKEKIKCKDCPYFSGIQCHGHGDFWGECNLLVQQSHMLKKFFIKDDNDLLSSLVPNGSDCWGFVCDENSTCKLFEIERYVYEKKEK